MIVQGVGEWLSEIATVNVCDPAAPQTNFVVADEAARKEPAVAVQAKASASPLSASDAMTETSSWPPEADVICGEICQEESTGQLSPGTTVPVMTTEPGGPASELTLPQVIVTGTSAGCPTVTLNGALVPLQLMPWLVVVVMVTVSPFPVGTLTFTEGVAFGSVVFTVPEASTTLVDESIFHATELTVTPPGRASATSRRPSGAPLPPLPQPEAKSPATSVSTARRLAVDEQRPSVRVRSEDHIRPCSSRMGDTNVLGRKQTQATQSSVV